MQRPDVDAILLHSADPVRFACEKLGFQPDPIQAEILGGRVRRGILNCTRQWGKSTVTAVMAVHRALTRPRSLTLVVSPSARQSGEFLRKAAEFVRQLGLKTRGDGDNQMSLLFPGGSRVVGLPGNETTVRGFSAVSLMLIDEAARVPDDMYRAVRPMLAVADGDLLLMSTPAGKRGFFWEEWCRGSGWCRWEAPATACPRISPEFLEEERACMGERWFRQEYLCEFAEAEDAVFDRDLIERAIRYDLEPF